MSIFSCPLCFILRKFPSFVKLFRHIGRFHRNDASFRITCNLNQSCGLSYRTYAGYKAHIYRHHSNSLKAVVISSVQYSPVQCSPDPFQDFPQLIPHDIDANVQEDMNSDDDDDSPFESSCTPDIDEAECEISLAEVQRIYLRFLLQLREEHLLPKKIISSISSNIVVLLESLKKLVLHRSASSSFSSTENISIPLEKFIIESHVLSTAVSDMTSIIEATTRSEHEFISLCKRLMDYQKPEEILLSSPGEKAEYGYIIPIEQTLSSLFHRKEIFSLISKNVVYQRDAVKNDEDLMFSLREGNFGDRFDDGSFLVQLYIDDIGVTNPIGSRSNRHKMTMVYFSLEDIPDKFRSEVQSINLLAVVPSNCIKVRKICHI